MVDDESDYYSTDTNQWLRPTEREALRQKKDDLHSQRHASRKDLKVTLDFAGRRVLEERNIVDSHLPLDSDKDTQFQSEITPEDFQYDIVNPTLRVPPPKVCLHAFLVNY